MQTKTIDGLAVSSTSLEPADAYDLLPELVPVIGAAFGAKDALILAAKGDGNGIASALNALGQTLGAGKLTDLLVRLLKTTFIAGPDGVKHRVLDRGTFSLAFAGRMWSAIPVAAFAFEVTFGNFSDVAQRLGGGARPPAEAPSNSAT